MSLSLRASVIMIFMLLGAFAGSAKPLEKNLLLARSVHTRSGSLAGPELLSLLEDDKPMREIRVLPHDLVVTWTQAVRVNTLDVTWHSEERLAEHYGLEIWDDENQCFWLAFEERSNTKVQRSHTFSPITTTHVRFTVFRHPLSYDALVINKLALRFQPTSEHTRAP